MVVEVVVDVAVELLVTWVTSSRQWELPDIVPSLTTSVFVNDQQYILEKNKNILSMTSTSAQPCIESGEHTSDFELGSCCAKEVEDQECSGKDFESEAEFTLVSSETKDFIEEPVTCEPSKPSVCAAPSEANFSEMSNNNNEAVIEHVKEMKENKLTETSQQSQLQEVHEPTVTKGNQTLEEYLSSLDLSHLLSYLAMLGCTSVSDLRLLDQSEVQAIQLVARRRLFHHLPKETHILQQAPGDSCDLQEWLSCNELSYLEGFLTAIGVQSLTDLAYLTEEDLQLLRPVARRRLMALPKRLL